MQRNLVILIAVLLFIFGFLVFVVEKLSNNTAKGNNLETTIRNDDQAEKYTYIHDIQGIGHISPLNGENVTNVYGIVTVSGPTFYIIQTPSKSKDADLRTSEAIKVKAFRNHDRKVGELILIDGTVDEYRPEITSFGERKVDRNALTLTQIKNPTNVRVLKTVKNSMMPKPMIIGKGGRIPPNTMISLHDGSVETKDYELNLEWGLDFYESLESMLVQVNDALVISPLEYSSVFITPNNGFLSTGLNQRKSIAITDNDYNPEIIKVKSGYKQKRLPSSCETGDYLGTVIGTIDYDWGNFTIYTTEAFQYKNNALRRERSTLTADKDRLTVASFNMLNLDARDSYERFNDLAQIVVNNLRSPDILVLEEIQDNNGASAEKEYGGTGSEADKTFGKLINAITQAQGPEYEYAQIDPVFGQEGGEPVGNIRVGFLYNPKRVTMENFGAKFNKSTTATEVKDIDGKPGLSLNPGRIDPKNQLWRNSRPAIVGEFIFNDQKVFIIGVHFRSKGGDASTWGWNQNQKPASESGRTKQAKLVRDFASKILSVDNDALVMVAGDFNEYYFREPLKQFEEAGIINPAYKLDENDRYSMIYAGNAQLLDHILVSKAFYEKVEYDIVHVNSEFHDQASDHDPVLTRIYIPSKD